MKFSPVTFAAGKRYTNKKVHGNDGSSLEDYAKISQLPTKLSQLINDKGYVEKTEVLNLIENKSLKTFYLVQDDKNLKVFDSGTQKTYEELIEDIENFPFQITHVIENNILFFSFLGIETVEVKNKDDQIEEEERLIFRCSINDFFYDFVYSEKDEGKIIENKISSLNSIEKEVELFLEKAKDSGKFKPQVGIDYFTESDINEMIEKLKENLPLFDITELQYGVY